MNWVELEESESSALAAGGADTRASSGLKGHWLDRDDIGGWAEDRRSGGFLRRIALAGEGCPAWFWGSWVGIGCNRSEDEKVGWSSLLEDLWSCSGFLSEGEERGFSSVHGSVVSESRVRGMDWLVGSRSKRLELHLD